MRTISRLTMLLPLLAACAAAQAGDTTLNAMLSTSIASTMPGVAPSLQLFQGPQVALWGRLGDEELQCQCAAPLAGIVQHEDDKLNGIVIDYAAAPDGTAVVDLTSYSHALPVPGEAQRYARGAMEVFYWAVLGPYTTARFSVDYSVRISGSQPAAAQAWNSAYVWLAITDAAGLHQTGHEDMFAPPFDAGQDVSYDEHYARVLTLELSAQATPQIFRFNYAGMTQARVLPVPEPAALPMLLGGLLALGLLRRARAA